MTPNVQIAVQLYPDRAADYKWFDVGTMPDEREFTHEEMANLVLQPLPFERIGVAGEDMEGVPFATLVTKGTVGSEYEGALFIESAIVRKDVNGLKDYAPKFWLRPKVFDSFDGLEISFVNPGHEHDARARIASKIGAFVVALFLETIHNPDAQYQMYTATPKSNNAKRIRQGKKPMFDWHTVLIEPPRQKMPDQGGTHASPRLHDVRGHWVKRGDKRYWRKAHQRGDASIGVVFHDYKLKGEANGKQTA
jgi:hypothetical protein